MDLFPFISRRSHEAIVAGKDEQVALLRFQVGYLQDLMSRGETERDSLNSRLVAALTPKLVPIEPSRRRREPEALLEEPKTLDLSLVDPNDNEALMIIVSREVPPGTRTNASSMMRSVERLRKQVIAAHEHRMTQVSSPAMIPSSVVDRIAQAEREGIQAAQQAGA